MSYLTYKKICVFFILLKLDSKKLVLYYLIIKTISIQGWLQCILIQMIKTVENIYPY